MYIKTNYANIANYKECTGRDIKYIVLHYTANNGDTAEGNGVYFARERVGASAHYFVDENSILRSVADKDIAWHCETAGLSFTHKYCRNSNSIAIEMCSRKYENGRYYIKPETVNNAVELTRTLMEKYNITIDRVLRHYDVKPKLCPKPWVEDNNLWLDFLERLDDEMIEKSKIIVDGKEIKVSRILKDGSNYVKIRDIAEIMGYEISSKGNIAVLTAK